MMDLDVANAPVLMGPVHLEGSGNGVCIYLEVHYWKAVSLCFPHNCGEILQVGRQECSEGGQQSCSPGLLEALKISSDVPRKWHVQSNQA